MAEHVADNIFAGWMMRLLHCCNYCLVIIVYQTMLNLVSLFARFQNDIAGAQIWRQRIADTAEVDNAHVFHSKIHSPMRMSHTQQIRITSS